MSMNKKEFVLNRKQYQKVRKMDHGQMSAFCEELYKDGYEAGKHEGAGLSDEEIKQEILRVKGIGEKKADDILQALNQAKERRMLVDG